MTSAGLEAEQESRERDGTAVTADAQFWNWSAIFWLVLVAFAMRLSFLLVLKTYRLDRIGDNRIAGEITNVALSIVRGRGFSSPFNDVYTGPTACLAPVYPYFVAFVFRFLGLMTQASVIFILTVQSLFSALTVIPILGLRIVPWASAPVCGPPGPGVCFPGSVNGASPGCGKQARARFSFHFFSGTR